MKDMNMAVTWLQHGQSDCNAFSINWLTDFCCVCGWCQCLETEFGWILPSKRGLISSLHPSPLMKVMTGAKEETRKPPTSVSVPKTDFQPSAPPPPLTGEEEGEDSRWRWWMKTTTGSCKSQLHEVLKTGDNSRGVNSWEVCLTQRDHSDGHGDMGELGPVGLLVLFQLQDFFIRSVSHGIKQFCCVPDVAPVITCYTWHIILISCVQVSPITLQRRSGWSITPQELLEIRRAT